MWGDSGGRDGDSGGDVRDGGVDIVIYLLT